MTNYMLYRLTKRSNNMMADMLRIHHSFAPPEDRLLGMEVDEVLESWPRQIETCKVNLQLIGSKDV